MAPKGAIFLCDEASDTSSLLPLWEKVVRTQSAPDEGSLSAEADPSPVRDAAHRVHPLPQGERGRRNVEPP